MAHPSPRAWLAGLLLVAGLGAPPVGAVVTQSVKATGTAAIVAGDRANAFEQAKKAALREAVEQAAGTLVTASTQVEGFALFSDAVFLQTAWYVRRYRVVSQGESEPGTFQVGIEAEVDLGFLHQQLEARNLLIDAVGNPPLLCLGREVLAENRSAELGWGVVAGELEKCLKDASSRFHLLSPGSDAWQLGDALALARSRGAEVLVLGQATLHPLPNARVPGGNQLRDLGIHSARAEVEVRLLRVDTGEVVAVLSQNTRAAAGSFDAAARKAAQQGAAKVAPQLVRKLLKDWQERLYAGRLVQVQVEASAGQLRRFEREFPQRVSGIDQLRSRQITGGVGRFEARARHEAFQIARELSARGMGDLNVEILGVTANTLSLKLSD